MMITPTRLLYTQYYYYQLTNSIMKNIYKLITLGDQAVGKTSIVENYINNKFSQVVQPTLGACFYKKDIIHQGKTYSFEIWDTAGQQRYQSLLKLYYRNADVVLLVFDITSRKSYDRTLKWLQQIEENCEEMPCIIMVGNKIDLVDSEQVSYEEVKSFVGSKQNWGFMYVSAKDSVRIDALFIKAIELLVQKSRKIEPPTQSNSKPKPNERKQQKLKWEPEKQKKKSGPCC